ncbi:MAG: ADP-forming succinate--CoA ligase subunit beta [Candidatus Neomarinimicrobiota bacterium]|nr:ADP-forming succinate--CoA ligase subunit beta [Candidatus Neomarinimicrobiota bacterium]
MKIHEYQAKEILRQNGVPVPAGVAAFSVNEAVTEAKNLGGNLWVVKAQIHAGGRGKGGGVKIAKNLDEVREFADQILGMNLVTHQTGPTGKKVNRLLIEEGVDIARELYGGIVLDRSIEKFVFMVSTEGGVEIEKVAEETPEKIVKVWIEPPFGLTTFQARQLAFALRLEGEQVKNGVKMFKALWRTFDAHDCSLAEINPMVVTGDGRVMALDAKMNFDENGLYRQKVVAEMRDISEELPSETEAASYQLNYIKLDGNVGCMVNGAGLAMATMDIIKLSGGEPANFLDVGGVANSETVSRGFKLILTDPNVRSILINIFGGIVRCDRVAQGVVDALSTMEVSVPVVVRLEGTNAREAGQIFNDSPLDFIVATSLKDGAEKAVEAISA